MAIQVVMFNYSNQEGAPGSDQEDLQMGVLAQQLQAIDPNAVVRNGQHLSVKQVQPLVDIFARQSRR